jgi:hypothetical protein
VKEKENFELAAKILFFGTLEESFSIETAKGFAKAENKEVLLSAVHALILKRKNKMSNLVHLTQGAFVFPEGIDMSYWREFKTNCPRDAFLAVLYKWIGGVSDEELCNVLQVSKGSLYSRYNLGLKSLGELLVSSQVMLGV